MEHEQTEIMREVFRNVFRDMQRLQAKAYLSLLPGEITILRKNILVDYRIIPDSSCPRIMLILTDVTEKKELEKARKKGLSHARGVNTAGQLQGMALGLEDPVKDGKSVTKKDTPEGQEPTFLDYLENQRRA